MLMMQIDNVILRNFCIIRLIRKIMVVMFKKNIYVPPFYRNIVIMMLSNDSSATCSEWHHMYGKSPRFVRDHQ